MELCPIVLQKNGLIHNIKEVFNIKTPFMFIIPDKRLNVNNNFYVNEDEQPIFFARKRLKIKGGKITEHFIYRYCIGARNKEGQVRKFWIKPNGDFDGLNTEPDKGVI